MNTLCIFLNQAFAATFRPSSLVGAMLVGLGLVLGTASTAYSKTDTSNGNSLESSPTEQKSIEDAQNALDQAKSALENAQNTLNQARTKQQEASKPKISQRKIAQQSNKAKSGGRLYKWVDAQGNISYQDSPPPKDVKVLDADVLKDAEKNDKPIKELRRANEPAPVLDGSVPVMVYTADNCKPCQSVVLFLTQKQVPFIERDIRNDRKARERLSNLSKQISVPSLFIGERIIQGHSKPMITRALEEAGYLKP